MTVLITGGFGFIGSHLASRLQEAGTKVYIVDSVSDYYSTDLKRTRRRELLTSIPDTQVFEINICDRSSFKQILQNISPKTVIHLAAQAGVRLQISKLHNYSESNLMGFSNVLQSVIETNTPNFLYASSSSVYGNSTETPYKEKAKGLKPISFYGATKLSNEFLTHAAVIGSKTRARGMRFFTVYGPWGRPDMAYFRLVSSLLTDYQFHLFGDGSVKRDFTYVDDTVMGIDLLAKQLEDTPDGYSDIVNLGGGKPHSINDLIYEFEEVTKRKIQVINEENSPGDVRITAADSTYLEHLTGFVPSISLTEGAQRFFDWASDAEIKRKLSSWLG
jgi:UDP-glucuronate 4-epimerase